MIDIPNVGLADGAHYNVHVFANVGRRDGTFWMFGDGGFDFADQDVPPADGENHRLVSCTVSANVDVATIEATLTLSLGRDTLSLSPYIAASQYNFGGIPLLAPGSVFELWAAITPPGVLPTSTFGDYRRFFTGRVDEVDLAAGRGLIRVRGRDRGGFLLNRFIRATKVYGTTDGTPAEDVLVALLNDNGFDASWLSVPASPGFLVRPFQQERISLLDGMRQVALQTGWELRMYPSVLAGTQLVYQDPQRDRASQYDISGDLYLNVEEFKITDDDVRNIWRVGYPPATGEPRTIFVEVEDATSRFRYGDRFAEVVLDRSRNIDTEGEALTYATAALADNKEPLAQFGISMLPWPFVELNDVYTFIANGLHHDTDQVWAIAKYDHTFERGSGRTKVAVRPKPVAAYRDYRRGTQPRQLISTQPPPADFIPAEGTRWSQVTTLPVPA